MIDGIKVIQDIDDKDYEHMVSKLHEGVGLVLQKYGNEHIDHGVVCELLNDLCNEMDLPIYFVPYSFKVLINAKEAKGLQYEFPTLLSKFKLIWRDYIRRKLSLKG